MYHHTTFVLKGPKLNGQPAGESKRGTFVEPLGLEEIWGVESPSWKGQKLIISSVMIHHEKLFLSDTLAGPDRRSSR